MVVLARFQRVCVILMGVIILLTPLTAAVTADEAYEPTSSQTGVKLHAVAVTPPDTVSYASPPARAAPAELNVEGSALAPATAERGKVDVVMLQLSFYCTPGVGDDASGVAAITFDNVGTGADGDATVKVYEEATGDGVLDPAPVLLGTGTFAGGSASVDVTDFDVFTATVYVMVCIDVSGGAGIGNTVELSIVDGTYLTLTENSAAVLPGGVINSGATTIQDASINWPIVLENGINFISLPLEQQDTSLGAALSTIAGDYDCVEWFDASAGTWKKWEKTKQDTGNGELNSLTDVDHSMGLWINVIAGGGTMLTVSGFERTDTGIQLYSGWNMVGYPYLTPQTLDNALSSIAGKYDCVEEYVASDGADPWKCDNEGDLTLMQPGHGYWIHATEPTMWTVRDWTPPAAVVLNAATGSAVGSVDLDWTAPGDDGNTGTASVYDVRYSGSPITAANWDSATQVTGEPVPSVAGSGESMTITGLTAGQTYYFALKTADEGPNWSPISNSPSAAAFEDTVGPATSAVSATPNPTDGAATVTLTANVDDSTTGGSNVAAAEYFVDSVGADGTGTAMAASDGNFNSPAEGVTVDIDVSGWTVGTYTLYVHGQDAYGNWGATQSTTLDVTVTPDTQGPVTTAVSATPNPTEGAATVTLTANVDDSAMGGSDIAEAEYFVDSVGGDGTGTAMSASDGNFNSPTEGVTVDIDVSGWSTGTYNLYVHGRDSAGNWGTTASTTLDVTAAPDTQGPVTSAVSATPNPTEGAATVTLTANVDDSSMGGSNIAEAEYFVDTVGGDGTGTAMSASDGNFNSPTEDVTVDIDVSGWSTGTYTLYVHGRDAVGNWGATASTTLDVTVVSDTIPPQVVSTTPTDGATGVIIGTTIVVVFDEPMDQAATEAAFSTNPGVTGTFSWNGAGDTMTFTPDADLAYTTTYTVTITTGAMDLAGNTLDGDGDGVAESNNKDKYEFSFTTEDEPDLTGPVVSNVQATPDPVTAGVSVTLTADVDDSTTGGSNVAEAEWSEGASAAAAGSGTSMAAQDGTFDSVIEAVTATVDTTGWSEGSHTLWVRGRDSQGNWGSAVSTSIQVNAPDTTPPQVVTNTPADGAANVAVSTNIVVEFDEEMDQANTEGAFEISPSVTGSFSWNPAGTIMTFNPDADLAGATTYTVTIHVTATDLAGNTLDGDKDGNMEAENKDKWVFSFDTAGGGPGSKYAVVVGVNNYVYQADLSECVNDANEVRTNLNGEGYTVDLYTDNQATKANILAALDDMATAEVSGDYTAFSFAGHGGHISGKCCIIPTEGYDLATSISEIELDAKFDAMESGSEHLLVFFDSCESGGMSVGGSGRLIIMACTATENSFDAPEFNNGLWTYFFWEDGYRCASMEGNPGWPAGDLEGCFSYSAPLATDYVATNYGASLHPQISDGYTGSFYL